MATQGYTDNYASTLSGGYSSGGTTLSVTSASGLPASGQEFYVSVAAELLNTTEIFKVTSYSGTTLTVVGAQANTSASNHSSAAVITGCWIVAAVLDGIRADIHQSGTIATLPSNPRQGDSFFPTDSVYDRLVWDSVAGAWDYFYRGRKLSPPGSISWSWNNQGSATATQQTNGVLTLASPSNGNSDNVRSYEFAAPSTPWSKFFRYTGIINAQNFNNAGLALRESGTGKLITIFVTYNSGAGFGGIPFALGVDTWNSVTSHDANHGQALAPVVGIPNFCIKVSDDGTNITVSWSNDNGINFIQLYQAARNAWFSSGPDKIGIAVNPNDQSGSNINSVALIGVN